MLPSAPSVEIQRRIVEQWRETGPLLEALRFRALAAQTAEESQHAAFDMLQLGGMLPPDPARESSSGMVEMQRLFARQRGRAST